ncbi:hypothetical protein O181_010018 [Austropuccinia psidii MF-1]|uniref:Integrase catalytic domain-containing protein n=1 Tax=Austropuccinia psidii MF-1 TaxID=1389203 RepID=A0A9Q3GJZ1_9BASI|nr:hypothetical protein [Austropuccinia psidii MF-1]
MQRQLAAHDEAPQEQARDLMISDVLGPMPILDLHNNKYILTLRDHFLTFVFCFPIKTRDEVPTVLTKTFALIHSVFGKYAEFLRSDNAKEYMGKNFKISLMGMGTQKLFTCPYTPEQNGEAERLNRTLEDSARTMLKALGLSKQFWSYGYKCAAYIDNRIPNSRTGAMTPLELWCGRRPQPKRIFPFGAKAIVHVPIEKRGKLCQLIGFQNNSHGYFFWDDNSKKVINSNHVKFMDFSANEQSDKMKITTLLNKLELRLGQENTEVICDEQDNALNNLTTVTDVQIPTSLTEVKKLNWDKWRAAIELELVLFLDMDVWTPVEKQTNMKTIRTKFVFDLKWKGNPEEILYKARLVAKGFCQEYGIDYVWTDADWGGEFQRLTTGFIFKLFGCTVAWGSRRQKLVATSTRSNFLYDTGTLQATSVPKTIGTPALTKMVAAREQYISNFNSNGSNASSIQKDRNLNTNIKRNFSTNRPDASRSELYKKYKQNLKSNSSRTSSDTNKIKNQPINATVTKDNDNNIAENISYESA